MLGTYRPLKLYDIWKILILENILVGKYSLGTYMYIYICMYNKPLNDIKLLYDIVLLYEIISWGMRIPHHQAIIGYLDVPRILTHS